MTEQKFVYRGRPVVDHRIRDKVRKMASVQKSEGGRRNSVVPEHMAGKVVRRGHGYCARVFVDGKPHNGPIRESAEMAFKDWSPLFQRGKQLEGYTKGASR